MVRNNIFASLLMIIMRLMIMMMTKVAEIVVSVILAVGRDDGLVAYVVGKRMVSYVELAAAVVLVIEVGEDNLHTVEVAAVVT